MCGMPLSRWVSGMTLFSLPLRSLRCFQAGPCFGSHWVRVQARVSDSLEPKFPLSSSEPKVQTFHRN